MKEKQDRKQQVEGEREQEEFTDPYNMLVYVIRSPNTKGSYFGRLRRFFDAINSCKGESMVKRWNAFAYRYIEGQPRASKYV
jgi:hypothetical protein